MNRRIHITFVPGIPLTEPDDCEDDFGPEREDDLRKIASYNFLDIDQYMKLLFPSYQDPSDALEIKHEIVDDKNVTVPAIVTAADYSHFKEAMNLINNMNQGVRMVYPQMKLVFFDLGLSRYQREQVLKHHLNI